MSTSNPSGPQSSTPVVDAPATVVPPKGSDSSPESKTGSAGTSGSSSSSSGATAREIEQASHFSDETEAKDAEITRTLNENRAQAREDYEGSEQGAVARQIREAEKAMRGPSPAPGFEPGDPTKGPSR